MKIQKKYANFAILKIASNALMLQPAPNALILFIMMQEHADYVQKRLLAVETVIIQKLAHSAMQV